MRSFFIRWAERARAEPQPVGRSAVALDDPLALVQHREDVGALCVLQDPGGWRRVWPVGSPGWT